MDKYIFTVVESYPTKKCGTCPINNCPVIEAKKNHPVATVYSSFVPQKPRGNQYIRGDRFSYKYLNFYYDSFQKLLDLGLTINFYPSIFYAGRDEGVNGIVYAKCVQDEVVRLGVKRIPLTTLGLNGC